MQRNLFSEFACFAPDGGGSAGTTQAPPSAVPQAVTPPTGTTPESPPVSPSPAASPAATPPADAGTPATIPAVPSAPSWLDSLRKDNVTFVGKDEAETIANMKRINDERQQLESIRPLIPYLNSYRTDAAAFQKWKAEQQKQQAAPKANEPSWSQFWKAPEYNESWMQQVTKDAAGNLVPIPGASPDVVPKLQQYLAYQQEEMRKFSQNPHAYMEGFIEQKAQTIAQKAIQEHFTQHEARQGASKFIEANKGWLYDIDQATGQPRQQLGIDPQTGQQTAVPLLSPWGQRFKAHATEVHSQQQRRGYHDEAEIERLAFERVSAEFDRWQLQEVLAGRLKVGEQTPVAPAAPQKTPQELANEKFLNKNNPPGARQPGGGSTTPAEPEVTKQNFKDILRQQFAAAGITDQTLRNGN